MTRLSSHLDFEGLHTATYESSPSEFKARTFSRAEVPDFFQLLADASGQLIESGPALPPGGYKLFRINVNGDEWIVASQYQGRYFEVSVKVFQSLLATLK